MVGPERLGRGQDGRLYCQPFRRPVKESGPAVPGALLDADGSAVVIDAHADAAHAAAG